MESASIYPAVSQGQPMQQTGQYAVPVSTNATVPIEASLQSIEPPGKCCFCIPAKAGAMIVAIITLIVCVYSIFSIFNGSLNTGLNLIMAIVCLIGAFLIYVGSYRLLPIYAAVYTIITIISIGVMMFILYLIPTIGIKELETLKRNWLIAGGVVSIIRLYFVYVTIEYTIKLRNEVTKRQNAKSNGKPGGF